jgi:high-affinity Fe2+/Pb2+ permease
MFMVPLTILFAALGVSTTHGLKAGISLVGLATSVVWGIAVWHWPQATDLEKYSSTGLAAIFAAVMLFSCGYHAYRYKEGDDEPVVPRF